MYINKNNITLSRINREKKQKICRGITFGKPLKHKKTRIDYRSDVVKKELALLLLSLLSINK